MDEYNKNTEVLKLSTIKNFIFIHRYLHISNISIFILTTKFLVFVSVLIDFKVDISLTITIFSELASYNDTDKR